MKHCHYTEVPAEPVEDGAVGVSIRHVISEADGAPNFVMRVFEVAPGGSTPRHSHPWEHEVLIMEGHGRVHGGGTERAFGPGDVMYVAPNEEHQFRNDSDDTVRFVCLVPRMQPQ